MLDKIVITKENGETVNADFISCFRTNVGGRDAVFYLTTVNEVDPNGLYKIQASELIGGKLTTIASDTDWGEVKNIMRAIISSSPANFTYIEKTTTLSATNDYGRIIAVQLPAKDKMAADYKEKLPQATIDNIIGDTKVAPDEAPLNTPDIAGASVVAPGIVETPVVDTMDVAPSTAPTPVAAPVAPTLEPPVLNPTMPVTSASPLDSASTAVNPLGQTPVMPSTPVTPNLNPVNNGVATPDVMSPINPVTPVANPMPMADPMVANQVPTVDPTLASPMPAATPVGVNPMPAADPLNANPLGAPVSPASNINPADLEKELESVIAEAQTIFLDSARNLANKIITEAIEKVKNKM